MQPEGTRYGRTHKEWRELIDAGRQFVVEQARLGRMTTYTELNTVLRQRTSVRTFDFDLDSERAAMGELLGEIVQLERPNFEGHMISAIVIYLNETTLVVGSMRLPSSAADLPYVFTRGQRDAFWADEVLEVHRLYRRSRTQ